MAESEVVARLVAATCPKCGAGVRIDPDHETVTCAYCGVSSFIQTRRRAPTEQAIRAHQPIIHLENTARRISGCVSALISVGVLGAVGVALAGVFASNLPRLAQHFLGADGGSPIPITVPGLASAFTPPVVVEENLFATPSLLKTQLEQRLGKPVLAKQLVLYPTYARAIAQDPKQKQHLDSYFYRNGVLEAPEPERLSGRDKQNVDKLVFSLDALEFTKLPGLLTGAAADLAIEAGAVTHVIIERGGFGAKAPVVRVYVNGPRDSGYVEYDLNGRRTRVAK